MISIPRICFLQINSGKETSVQLSNWIRLKWVDTYTKSLQYMYYSIAYLRARTVVSIIRIIVIIVIVIVVVIRIITRVVSGIVTIVRSVISGGLYKVYWKYKINKQLLIMQYFEQTTPYFLLKCFTFLFCHVEAF